MVFRFPVGGAFGTRAQSISKEIQKKHRWMAARSSCMHGESRMMIYNIQNNILDM